MSDSSRDSREMAHLILATHERVQMKSLGTQKHTLITIEAAVDALADAGLLMTDDARDLMYRLTPTVLKGMKGRGLVGARIGVASDFRTDIEERAVAACREYAAAWDEKQHFHSHGSKGTQVLTVGREIIAAETPKQPKWIAQRVLDSQRWNVGKPECHDGSVGSATFVLSFHTERDAKLVVDALNAVDAGKA